MKTPKLLIIAGSDPTSGAGLQSDCLTAFSLGVYPMTIVTSVTSQNDLGVIDRYDLPSQVIASQLEGLLSRFDFAAVKIGMLGTHDTVIKVAAILKKYKHKLPFIVLDPVLKASNAFSLSEETLSDAMRQELMPLLSLITPNRDEFEALYHVGHIEEKDFCDSLDYYNSVSTQMHIYAHCAILLKGGHFIGDAIDLLIKSPDEPPIPFKARRIATPFSHGTGCTLSTAICAFVLKQYSLEDAVREAKSYLLSGLSNPVDLGNQYGAINKWPTCQSRFTAYGGK